jgi:hypothetical protein
VATRPARSAFVIVLVLAVVDDSQDQDEAEGGSQPAQGRLLLGVDLGHGRRRPWPRWLVASGPQVQVDLAALKLELALHVFAALAEFERDLIRE